MAEYLLVNDVHLSDRPPSSCTESYLDDLFDMLEHIVYLAASRKAEAIILAGDVFHLKTPGRTSHKTVMRFMDLAGDSPARILVVPGNHDMSHDRLESIMEAQPLGVVFAAQAAFPLVGFHALHDGLISTPIFGVPWLKAFTDDTVREALADYREPGANCLVVTHAPLYPPGRELPYENYPAAAWAAAMGGQGAVHYGHVHEPHGIYTVDGVTFSNPGALSRGSLHEHNLTRPVQIAVWNSDTATIEHLDVPHRPASAVLRIAEAVSAKGEKAAYATFLDAIGDTRLNVTSVESVIEHLRSSGDIDPGLIEVIVGLLRESEAAR